jgi:uncharacterized iron-regulated membrane protein
MKIKKKTFFKIHSWIGIHLSVLFFIVCFSGTLATLSHEMDWLFNPAARATPQKELASRNRIMDNFKKAYPDGKMTYWMRTDEPYLCDILYKTENGLNSYVFANPYTGEIQGESQITVQRFFRDLHYFLFIPFQIGHYTVLLFGFLLLISLITALAFYKKWWRKLFELQIGKGPLVLFRSLHRLVGIWSVPFTLLFSLTGIWYFIERANVGGLGETVNPRPPELPKGMTATEDGNLALDFDRAVRMAETEIPNLEVGNIVPPENGENAWYLIGKSEVPLVRQRANRVYLDPDTYKTIKVQKANEIGAAMLVNDIADPLHFGYWGGLWTKIIYFFLGLGISSLVLSGIWITAKRKAIKRKKTEQKVMGVWHYVNWTVYAILLGCMYYIILDRYQAPSATVITISLGWATFLAAAYYLFSYRLKRAVRRGSEKQ